MFSPYQILLNNILITFSLIYLEKQLRDMMKFISISLQKVSFFTQIIIEVPFRLTGVDISNIKTDFLYHFSMKFLCSTASHLGP